MKTLIAILASAIIGVIPQPVSMRITGGSCNVNTARTVFSLDEKSGIPAEGYTLEVTPDCITAAASTEAGLFYARKTLDQLRYGDRIPCVKISDYPRFAWRGFHVDPCRHFLGIDDIKKQIDILSQYKLNTFHWHLTDDQGWRIEIKKYPRLTEVGGWRTEFDGSTHGGYYTQDEIRDVVAYAAERFVTVVPEIEMPGHSLAAIRAYPWLSCTKEEISTFYTWGSPDIVLCAGNDSTYTFLEDVISEVAELFPGEYIHIGGDECQKTKWRGCAVCQARIASEGLKADEEFTAEEKLQSYAVRRMEGILAKYGKKLIGWDEILEGGLSEGATVMSWRGESGGIKAASAGHDVVMTPSKAGMYFDHFQGESKVEPVTIGNLNTLGKVYDYDPVPEELKARGKGGYIRGVQCNNWSEYMYEPWQREYMLFPRAFALAEIAWTPLERKNFDSFLRRMDEACKRLDEAGITYHIPIPEQVGGSCNSLAFTDSVEVAFTTSRPMTMVYTLDDTAPTPASDVYRNPFTISTDTWIRIAATTSYGKLGPERRIHVEKQPVEPASAPEDTWSGLRGRRTDGRFGGWDEIGEDAEWQEVQLGALADLAKLEKFDRNMPDSLQFYAAEAEGWFEVPEDDIYRFSSDCDLVWFDSFPLPLIDNDGKVKRFSHSDIELALSKGLHKIKVGFIYNVAGGWNSIRNKTDVLIRKSGDDKWKPIIIHQ